MEILSITHEAAGAQMCHLYKVMARGRGLASIWAPLNESELKDECQPTADLIMQGLVVVLPADF